MVRRVYTVITLLLLIPATAAAQVGGWHVDVTIGWAGLVDESTQDYLAVGASVRRRVTPRISIGPEVVVMRTSSHVTDRMVLFSGNVFFDLLEPSGRQFVPLVVGGGGVVWTRDQVANGPYSSNDPAFTAGGGVRGRIHDAVSLGPNTGLGGNCISGSVASCHSGGDENCLPPRVVQAVRNLYWRSDVTW